MFMIRFKENVVIEQELIYEVMKIGVKDKPLGITPKSCTNNNCAGRYSNING